MSKYCRYRFDEVRKKLNSAGFNPLDVMVTGVTGAGKSSTLNTLFEQYVAKVGEGTESETMDIESYSFNNGGIRFWDTPGLGDGAEADTRHSQKIIQLLHKTYGTMEQYGFIDLVLIIVDAGSKDLGTTYKLINEIIIPNFHHSQRTLVALNQCDMAMKGSGWDISKNKPSPQLTAFLNAKVDSVSRRIDESTGVQVRPIYYSTLYEYNIFSLLDSIVNLIPQEKRKYSKSL
ncbi:GTPase family protein [Paenibacillus sp. CAU 1782]